MSDHKKFRKKPNLSKKTPPRQVENRDFPVEVIVYDCVQHERCIAEYRNESKWWYSTRLQILRGEMGHRWIAKIHKILGSFDPSEVPTDAS